MDSRQLESRLKSLAYRIVNLTDALPSNKVSKIISDQVLRPAFSAAANYRSACKAMSRKAFISKLSIAFVESGETVSWLEGIEELKLVPVEKLSAINKEATELASILAAARKTSQANLKKS